MAMAWVAGGREAATQQQCGGALLRVRVCVPGHGRPGRACPSGCKAAVALGWPQLWLWWLCQAAPRTAMPHRLWGRAGRLLVYRRRSAACTRAPLHAHALRARTHRSCWPRGSAESFLYPRSLTCGSRPRPRPRPFPLGGGAGQRLAGAPHGCTVRTACVVLRVPWHCMQLVAPLHVTACEQPQLGTRPPPLPALSPPPRGAGPGHRVLQQDIPAHTLRRPRARGR